MIFESIIIAIALITIVTLFMLKDKIGETKINIIVKSLAIVLFVLINGVHPTKLSAYIVLIYLHRF